MFFMMKFWLKKGFIYTHTGGGKYPGKSLCKDKHIMVRFIKVYIFCFIHPVKL